MEGLKNQKNYGVQRLCNLEITKCKYPMWVCPECKQRFINKNQWHSCGQNTVSKFLEGKSEQALELYHHLIQEFEKFGDFDLHPAKTRLALNNKMRFASINNLGKECLSGHLVLTKRYEDNLCFHRIESVTKSAHVHHYKICRKIDLTDELKSYMKMAFEEGRRIQLEKKDYTAKNF